MAFYTYNVSDTQEVIEIYVELVNDWVKHVESGLPLDECFPLASDYSSDSIRQLQNRTYLLENKILPDIDKIPWNLALI